MPFSYLPEPDDKDRVQSFKCSCCISSMYQLLWYQLQFSILIVACLQYSSTQNVQPPALFSLRALHSDFISPVIFLIIIFPFQFNVFNLPDSFAYRTFKKHIPILHQVNNLSLNNQPANSEVYFNLPGVYSFWFTG